MSFYCGWKGEMELACFDCALYVFETDELVVDIGADWFESTFS